MISEKEAQELITKLISLRKANEKKPSPKLRLQLQRHERLCMEKFRYLVTMRTNRYKSFANYEDLNQEGYYALLKAMKNYNPKKGIFFYWAHKYIETRIARSANLHTAIRFPLKFARINTPHKESQFPLMIETRFVPDKIFESNQITTVITSVLNELTPDQRDIVSLAFGFSGEKPMSMAKICKKKSLSRQYCAREMDTALSIIKEKIKL